MTDQAVPGEARFGGLFHACSPVNGVIMRGIMDCQ